MAYLPFTGLDGRPEAHSLVVSRCFPSFSAMCRYSKATRQTSQHLEKLRSYLPDSNTTLMKSATLSGVGDRLRCEVIDACLLRSIGLPVDALGH